MLFRSDEAIEALPDYLGWGPASGARSIWEVRLQVAYLESGCPGFRGQVDRLLTDPAYDLYGLEIDTAVGLAAECG